MYVIINSFHTRNAAKWKEITCTKCFTLNPTWKNKMSGVTTKQTSTLGNSLQRHHIIYI